MSLKGGIFTLLVLLIGTFAMAQSQFVDDSTKQVYGPYTTYYQTFDEILNNSDFPHKIDSTVGGMHRFSMVEKSNFRYQNLGNLGTALRPVFYELPTQVGIRSGYDAYVPYYITSSDIQHFDTKSPYTPLDVVLGGNGRTITNIRHTRNITPYWNVGIQYRKINADKQVASRGRNDNHVTSLAYNFNMDYQSKTGKYRAIFTLSRLNHAVYEQGGIVIDEGDPITEFFANDANVNLVNARSRDFRIGYQVFNQYQVRKELQAYLNTEYILNRNFFTNKPLGTDTLFYRNFNYDILISRDSTTDQSQTSQFINEFGLKGDYTRLFYRFFLKLRNVNYFTNYLPGHQLFFENSGGFELRYDFDSAQNIRASGEYIVGGFYRLGGTYFNKFFTVEYWRTQSRPAIIENRFFGNHHEWNNNFATPASDMLRGSLIYFNRFLRVEPFASLINVQNNIYYGYDMMPKQANGSAQILSFGLKFNMALAKSIHWENEAVYTAVTGDSEAADAIRIPEIFVNSRLYYGDYWFNKKIYMMLGVDGHYKSDFYAPAYNPVVQQFYLQNSFIIPSYLLLNAFLEFQIQHLSMFIKFENLGQPSNGGYFVHPYYRGQPRIMDVGVRWLFFN